MKSNMSEKTSKKKSTAKKQTVKKKPKGLGDVIEKVTEVTRIKDAVKWIFGEDCGCDKRKEMLNELFPFTKKPNCMTEQQHKDFKKIKGSVKLNGQERRILASIHADIFSHKFALPCTCSPKRWHQWMGDVTLVYDTYK